VILERRKTKELSRIALARFAKQAQRAASLGGTVSILLTGDAEIQRLNRQFRQQDKPTDVLSFPSADPSAFGGDIVISTRTARLQASQLGHDLSTEVKILIIHGILHLAGFDHESDQGQMNRLEQKLRLKFKLPAGLIERAGTSQQPAEHPRSAATRYPTPTRPQPARPRRSS